jgi:hypothetical protein
MLRQRRPGLFDLDTDKGFCRSVHAVVWATAFALFSIVWVLVLGFAFVMTVVHDPELSCMKAAIDAVGGCGWYLLMVVAVVVLPPAFVASIVAVSS